MLISLLVLRFQKLGKLYRLYRKREIIKNKKKKRASSTYVHSNQTYFSTTLIPRVPFQLKLYQKSRNETRNPSAIYIRYKSLGIILFR